MLELAIFFISFPFHHNRILAKLHDCLSYVNLLLTSSYNNLEKPGLDCQPMGMIWWSDSRELCWLWKIKEVPVRAAHKVKWKCYRAECQIVSCLEMQEYRFTLLSTDASRAFKLMGNGLRSLIYSLLM